MQNAVMFLEVGRRNFEHKLSGHKYEYEVVCSRAAELELLIKDTLTDISDLEVALKVLKNG